MPSEFKSMPNVEKYIIKVIIDLFRKIPAKKNYLASQHVGQFLTNLLTNIGKISENVYF